MSRQFELDSIQTRVKKHVATLASEPRNFGSAHHGFSADYILTHLRDAGWKASKASSSAEEPEYVNVMTLPDLSPGDRLVVIGAHYDTPPGVPGADDNASGVATLLELAEFLSPRIRENPDGPVSVQLVAYDREEDGFEGSRSHSRALQLAGINNVRMIALEMLGYASARQSSQASPARAPKPLPPIGDFIAVCGNDASSALVAEVAMGLRRVPGQKVETMSVPGVGRELSESRSSDHSSFWDCGYEAVMVTDTALFRNPHYHRDSDTMETLDYSFLAQVTLGLCLAVEAIISEQAAMI